jgi:hypothetical protein
MMNTKEEGRGVNAANQVPPGTYRKSTVNPRAVNNGGSNGPNGPAKNIIVHLRQSGGHGVSCGLDLYYFRDVLVSRTVAEVSCARRLRAYRALTALRRKARRWDRLAGRQPKRTYKPQPMVSVATAFDRAAEVW